MEKTMYQEISKNIQFYKKPNELMQICVLKTKGDGIVTIYTKKMTPLIWRGLQPYIEKASIYFSLNEIDEDTLQDIKLNKVNKHTKTLVKDGNIRNYSFLHIDIDPIRGISGECCATKEERQCSRRKAYSIAMFLKKQFNFANPIIGDSGNGTVLDYYINLENNAENKKLISASLKAIASIYTDEHADVDVKVGNPARLVKILGCKSVKGLDTEERPHRYSSLLFAPKRKKIVTKEQLQKLVTELTLTKKEKDTMINAEEFMEKHNIEFKSKKEEEYGVVYSLTQCPFSDEHKDGAYLTVLKNGKISLKCHHNSCKGKTFDDAYKILEGEELGEENTPKKKKMEQIEVFRLLAKGIDTFQDKYENTFANVVINNDKPNTKATLDIHSGLFRKQVDKISLDRLGMVLRKEDYTGFLSYLSICASSSDNICNLSYRIAERDGALYYDLDKYKRIAVEIKDGKCKLVDTPESMFYYSKTSASQVAPDFTVRPTELLNIIKKHINTTSEKDTLMLVMFIVSSFFGLSLNHEILIIHGEKGSAKSTTLRRIQSIVDPQITDLAVFPTSVDDLAIRLSGRMLNCFDNLSRISSDFSNILCQACTGGTRAKRKLYTNGDEVLFDVKSIVALNGVSQVATQSDLLDRAMIISLNKISSNAIKTERVLEKEFQDDLPKILGACFNCIAQVLVDYKPVETDFHIRMADVYEFCIKIGRALEIPEDKVREIFESNQDNINKQALFENVVGQAILLFMQDKKDWKGSVNSLLSELRDVAEDNAITVKGKYFPSMPNMLSRRLNEIKSNLSANGIDYEIVNVGTYKEIRLQNSSYTGENIAKKTKVYKNPVLNIPLETESLIKFD